MSHQNALILLVEDHLALRRNLAFLLEVNGYDVLAASDGEEALGIMERFVPDVILSDIDMPGMNGYDLLCHVRADNRLAGVPFVFASDRYTLDAIEQAIALGADDYLPKPFDITDVLEIIAGVLPTQSNLRDTA